MQQQREPAQLAMALFRGQQLGMEAVLERIVQLVRQLGDVVFTQAGKLRAQDGLCLRDGRLVGRRGVVVDLADQEHGYLRGLSAQ